jgi:peptidoglycan/LPS O-acetylase OafA/YrhL
MLYSIHFLRFIAVTAVVTIVIPASLTIGALIYVAIDRPLLKWLRRLLLQRTEPPRPVASHSAQKRTN